MIYSVPDVSEALPPNALDLWDKFNQAWESLAKSVTSGDMIFELLEDIINNPLCFAVTGALWVVLGFKLFAYIISVVRARH